MRILIFFILISKICYSQKDTVFLRYVKDFDDTLMYTIDTTIFEDASQRNFLIGTTILPETENQMYAKSYGIYFSNVSKSKCNNFIEHNGIIIQTECSAVNELTSVLLTDTSMVISAAIKGNCCYDYLCDIAVDSSATLNLILHGYGSNCACECSYTLKFYFELNKTYDNKSINSVILNGNRKSEWQIHR